MSTEQVEVEYGVVNGWLVEHVGHHTCGTGPNGHYGAHEPGCGTEPIAPVSEILATEAEIVARTRENVAREIEARAKDVHSAPGDFAAGFVRGTRASARIARGPKL